MGMGWQQGLVVAASNPLTITSLSDLTCKKARLIDRQEGTFSKVLLDYLLDQEKIARNELYIVNKLARTEMGIGLTIASCKADGGIAVCIGCKTTAPGFYPSDN